MELILRPLRLQEALTASPLCSRMTFIKDPSIFPSGKSHYRCQLFISSDLHSLAGRYWLAPVLHRQSFQRKAILTIAVEHGLDHLLLSFLQIPPSWLVLR